MARAAGKPCNSSSTAASTLTSFPIACRSISSITNSAVQRKETEYSPLSGVTKSAWCIPVFAPAIARWCSVWLVAAPLPSQQQEPSKSLSNSLEMQFVLVPKGTFGMGSHESAEDLAEAYGYDVGFFRIEQPRHLVEISKA